MNIDGFFFNCLTLETDKELRGSRVEDVYSTDDGIVIQLRAPGRTLRLKISVYKQPFCFYLAKQTKGRGGDVFSQTVKKYILGLFCTSISNPAFDRIATLSFAATPQSQPQAFLHIELMGRQNDAILCQDKTIIASTRLPRRDCTRPLQPGDTYSPPPGAGKISPTQVNAAFLQTLFTNIGNVGTEKALVKSIFGISPLLAQEVCHRSGVAPSVPARELNPGQIENLNHALTDLTHASLNGDTQPGVYPNSGPYWAKLDDGTPQPFSDLSTALEFWVSTFTYGKELNSEKARLMATITTAIDKLKRTIAKQEAELHRAEEFQHLKEIGDTLLAGLHNISRGATSVTMTNVHTGEEISIPLDPDRSASSNANWYYKRYIKFKNGLIKVKEQIQGNNSYLEYLNSLEYALDSAATDQDLEDIDAEMREQGLLKKQKPKTKTKQRQEEFLNFTTPQGQMVMVGRNNRQNEILTLRKADKEHIWLHTRHCPGSHVVLCTATPDDSCLEFAAGLAAWFSKAKNSPKVEVVWTQVKNVKKIPGAKPGMVQYTDYRSLFIEPLCPLTDEESR